MRFKNFIQDTLGDPVHLAVLLRLAHHQHLTGRELARVVGVSQFKMRTTLAQLVEMGLLRRSQAGRSYLFSLNEEHFLIPHLKPLFQLETNLFEYLGSWILSRVPVKPVSLILYGSVARGDERADSDIDLLFVYSKLKSPDKMLVELHEALADGPQVFGNRFAPLVVSRADFKTALKKRDSFYRQIMKEGKVIAGLPLTELLL